MMLTEEISERKRLELELWKLAKQDSLTGLPNRLQFHEQLEAMLRTAREQGGQFAVGLIDVDRFKETNDILGHSAGDELLKEVGRRLQVALGPYGQVARLGGDEFAVLIATHGVGGRAERGDRGDVYGAASADHGCGRAAPLHHKPWDQPLSLRCKGAGELLKNADLALYRAKDLGRDRFQFFVPEMRASFEKSYQLHRDMQRALSKRRAGALFPADRFLRRPATCQLRGASALE